MHNKKKESAPVVYCCSWFYLLIIMNNKVIMCCRAWVQGEGWKCQGESRESCGLLKIKVKGEVYRFPLNIFAERASLIQAACCTAWGIINERLHPRFPSKQQVRGASLFKDVCYYKTELCAYYIRYLFCFWTHGYIHFTHGESCKKDLFVGPKSHYRQTH